MEQSNSLRQRLRCKLRATRAASPELRKNYAIALRSRRTPIPTILGYAAILILGGTMLFICLPIMMLYGLHDAGGLVLVFAHAGFWTLVAGFAFAEFLMKQLHCYSRLTGYAHLPVNDGTIAWDAWRHTALTSLPALYLLLLAYGVVAYQHQFSLRLWLVATVLAIVHYSLLVFLGTWMAVVVPRWKHYFFGTGLVAVIFLYIYAGSRDWAGLSAAALILLPTSWPGTVLFLAAVEGIAEVWLLLIPVVAMTLGITPLRNALIAKYEVAEFSVSRDGATYAKLKGAFRGAERLYWYDPLLMTNTTLQDPIEVAVQIRERGVAERRLKTSGWVERIVAGFLTPHEHSVLSFMKGDGTQWSIAANYLAGASAGLLLIRFSIPQTHLSPLLVVFWFGVISAFIEFFRGAESRRCGGHFIARFAEYPISAECISKAIVKATIVRAAIIGLLLLPIGVFWYGMTGFVFSAVCSLIALCAMIWHAAWQLSLGFKFPSTHRHMLRAVVLATAAVAGTVGGVIVSAAGWREHNHLSFVAGLCLMVISACVIRRLASWIVDSGGIDLVKGTPSLYADFFDRMATQRVSADVRRKYARNLCQQHGLFWRIKWLFGYA